MLFNSIDFAIFLPIVFIGYWWCKKLGLKVQNIFILLASYYFYGSWSPKFLLLIMASSGLDYLIGVQLGSELNQTRRKIYISLSLLFNLGLLMYFKYVNFFIDNFVAVFTFLGADMSIDRLDVILPVGISFYTFQTLSYSIDVYNRKLEPTHDWVAFFAFVSFFPQLVAGPIERASNLLGQFYQKREFTFGLAVDGSRQILWGLFKKIVIADNCAIFVNDIFANHEAYSGSTLLLGAIFFAFQIYGDFSGYSDIAIGVARLFGFELMQNFAYPYFSRDMAEFWRRWHISLSTWFREYLYIPLGGSRQGLIVAVRNTFIIFLVSGFWHGANWTFIVWGGLNALYFLPLQLRGKNRKNIDGIDKEGFTIGTAFNILSTFLLTCIAWVFFRAENIGQAVSYLTGIIDVSVLHVPEVLSIKMILVMSFLVVLLVFEWINRKEKHGLYLLKNTNGFMRSMIYVALIVAIAWFGGYQSSFIYFQF